jgi:hypothetical protein
MLLTEGWDEAAAGSETMFNILHALIMTSAMTCEQAHFVSSATEIKKGGHFYSCGQYI